MLRSVKQLYGKKLGASDGEIGHVKNFYFDVQNWAVRYLVAETGTWLTSRQVLLSPHALGNADPAGKVLSVNLTRKQIEDGPSLEWHKPVSRQYEEEYYRYYRWPRYWQGNGLWGMNDLPLLKRPARYSPSKSITTIDPQHERSDTHLRSAQAVKTCNIQVGDGIIGHVCDFMMDAQSWAIRQLVIKTTDHRLSAREIKIPTGKVDRINYEESTMFINLTGEVVRQRPAHRLTPAVAAA
jgi:sporulation protein YlmC with PRC-barrel domain